MYGLENKRSKGMVKASIEQDLERVANRIKAEHERGSLSPSDVYMLANKLDYTLRRIRFGQIVKGIIDGYEDEVFTFTNRQRIIKAVRRHFIGRAGRTNSPAWILKTVQKACPDLEIGESELILIVIDYIASKDSKQPISINFKFSADSCYQPLRGKQGLIPGIDWKRNDMRPTVDKEPQ